MMASSGADASENGNDTSGDEGAAAGGDEDRLLTIASLKVNRKKRRSCLEVPYPLSSIS
jgi:hypothetical protein